ncbi:prolipoprotein diacylglyceryl transferase [Actinomadura sp. 9N407]|uniref:prolipoprotein diacylglyceryl transferase n=1 Tax=Actinomadura sp. 9N407 TaxID=3375154 RepID=UPI0037A1F22F
MQPVAFIPSPSQGVWHLGFVPIRAYALMIIIGIVVAVWLGERRWAAKGGTPGVIIDIAVWAVPFGLVGGRLYHVITDYQRYFGAGRDPVDALKIWEGGLGIWGAVLLGGVGALIGCRRRGISVAALGDAVAPGIALAQGIGRWGNYWNQELYGRPLDAFWGLEIDQAHRPRLEDGTPDPQFADIATYHPTFLYESLWCIGVAILVIWADRRWKLTHGRAFALYIAGYTAGRFWIELLRIDDAHQILGMRLNAWTSLIVFIGAVGYIYWARTKTGPESVGTPPPAEPGGDPVPQEAGEESAPTAEAEPATEAPEKDPEAAAEEPGDKGSTGDESQGEKPAEAEKPEAEKSAEAENPAEAEKPEASETSGDEKSGDESAEPEEKPEPKDEADQDQEPATDPEADADPATGDNDTGGDTGSDTGSDSDTGGAAEADKGEPVKDRK